MVRERTNEVHKLLDEIRLGLLKVISPITPFLAESLWRELKQKEQSIHLSDWPKFDAKKINKKLEEEFTLALKIIEKGMAERDSAKIGLRWPLQSADITANFDLKKEMNEIIKKQLNVKEIFFDKVDKLDTLSVKLNTKTTPELEAEGFARELARKIQDARKKAGLQKNDIIRLKIHANKKINKFLSSQSEFLRERINAEDIEFTLGVSSGESISTTIKGEIILFQFIKLK
jgi:isoleucyl-tRNA synthetase